MAYFQVQPVSFWDGILLKNLAGKQIDSRVLFRQKRRGAKCVKLEERILSLGSFPKFLSSSRPKLCLFFQYHTNHTDSDEQWPKPLLFAVYRWSTTQLYRDYFITARFIRIPSWTIRISWSVSQGFWELLIYCQHLIQMTSDSNEPRSKLPVFPYNRGWSSTQVRRGL